MSDAAPPLPSSNPFTQYYAQLLHQGNMLADHVRTGARALIYYTNSCLLIHLTCVGTYQQAFLRNSGDFAGKVVLDVGTGTGILAFFAIQAGAKHVYAVEASESCKTAQILVDANGYSDRITILNGKIEEIIGNSLILLFVYPPTHEFNMF